MPKERNINRILGGTERRVHEEVVRKLREAGLLSDGESVKVCIQVSVTTTLGPSDLKAPRPRRGPRDVESWNITDGDWEQIEGALEYHEGDKPAKRRLAALRRANGALPVHPSTPGAKVASMESVNRVLSKCGLEFRVKEYCDSTDPSEIQHRLARVKVKKKL